MSSYPRKLSPAPSPGLSLGKTGAERSPEAAPMSTTPSVKERTRAWSSVRTAKVPMSAIAPPTLDELEAMDEGVVCTTPSASDVSPAKLHPGQRPFSRQVSRVSGTGRAVLQHAPKAAPKAAIPTVVLELTADGAASAEQSRPPPHQVSSMPSNAEQCPQARSNLKRRSLSADNLDRLHRPHSDASSVSGKTRRSPINTGSSRTVSTKTRRKFGGKGVPVATATPESTKNTSANTNTNTNTRARAPQRGTRGLTRRPSYTAQGTPSASKDNPRRPERKHSANAIGGGPNSGGDRASASKDDFDRAGGSRDCGIAASSDNDGVPKLRRHNSAPDMGEVFENIGFAEPTESPVRVSARESTACWGGGLPPTCNAIAQGPAVMRAAAVRAPPTTERYPERYPASDRESFARTLNDEELDEVWQGLGEGVSQRGAGSDVAFEGAPDLPSPGTMVSGAFPMLTANILERHDQLGVGGGGVRSGNGGIASRPQIVMPIPKDMEDRAAQDMENGTQSSKKSTGSSHPEPPSLLASIVSYGLLVLWMAHLVFNILLLWRVVVDHYAWALCFIPGLLGVFLSFSSCRKSHRNCKPAAEGDREEQRRNGPHPCALPTHLLLLISVLVALGMHASALLFCEKDMQLFITEATVEPLCNDTSLLLPVVLDAVLLSVASLKASSLCWAWVLA